MKLILAAILGRLRAPWPSPAASSACPTSASRRSSTRSRRPAPRPRTTRSAPSSRTSASCRCRTRASTRWSAVNPKTMVATTVNFVDIAGLVRGASKGEGLGNQFLANIRETDAIAHVVRCFEDDNVIHVEGRVDPVADVGDDRHRALPQGPRDRRQAHRARQEGAEGDRRRRKRSRSSSSASDSRRTSTKGSRRARRPDARRSRRCCASSPPHGEEGLLRRERRREAARAPLDNDQLRGRAASAHAEREGAPWS